MDASDLRYLNLDHAPLHHPLHHPFQIKFYNEMWFSEPLPSSLHQFEPLPEHHIDFDTTAETSNDFDSNNNSTNIPSVVSPIKPSDFFLPPLCTDPKSLYNDIASSTDKLFFVKFQLKREDPIVSGKYFVHFYGRHPADTTSSDVTARWWPLWHEYTISSDGTIDYSARVLFPPSRKVNSESIIPWGEVLNLSNSSIYLLGPFEFQEPYLNTPGLSSKSCQY